VFQLENSRLTGLKVFISTIISDCNNFYVFLPDKIPQDKLNLIPNVIFFLKFLLLREIDSSTQITTCFFNWFYVFLPKTHDAYHTKLIII